MRDVLRVDALRLLRVEGRPAVVLELVDDTQLLVLLDANGVRVRHVRPAKKDLPVFGTGHVLLAEDIRRAARAGDAAETARSWA